MSPSNSSPSRKPPAFVIVSAAVLAVFVAVGLVLTVPAVKTTLYFSGQASAMPALVEKAKNIAAEADTARDRASDKAFLMKAEYGQQSDRIGKIPAGQLTFEDSKAYSDAETNYDNAVLDETRASNEKSRTADAAVAIEGIATTLQKQSDIEVAHAATVGGSSAVVFLGALAWFVVALVRWRRSRRRRDFPGGPAL